MKNLVLVSGIFDVPEKVKRFLYIVSVNSWEEAILYLSGKNKDVAMFWGRDVPVDRLLKSVEDFAGNLLVYSEVDVSPVMRSRFTRVMRGRQAVVWREIGLPTRTEALLAQVRASMFGAGA